jgi:hypothetical protein
METEVEIVKNLPAVAEHSLRDAAMMELDKLGVGKALLTEQYSGMVRDASNALGMAQLKAARVVLREVRYKIDPIITETCRKIDSLKVDVKVGGEEIRAWILDLENPIHLQIKGEEDAKAEKKRLEQERKDNINIAINRMKEVPLKYIGLNVPDLLALIEQFEARPIGENYAEFQAEAQLVKVDVLKTLNETLITKQLQEADELRIKNEQEAENLRLMGVAEEQERITADNLRIATIKGMIAAIKAWPVECLNLSSVYTEAEISASGMDIPCSADDFAEFTSEAEAERVIALSTMTNMAETAAATEAGAVELQREKDTLAAAEKERTRVAGIKEMIQAMKALPLECLDINSTQIRLLISKHTMDLTLAGTTRFGEFVAEAEEVRIIALGKMNKMLDATELAENAENLKLKEQHDADIERDKLAEVKRLADKAVTDKEEKDRADALVLENQKRLDALTETHLSTLQAILAMAEDKSVKPAAALTGIIHLAKLGIEKGAV